MSLTNPSQSPKLLDDFHPEHVAKSTIYTQYITWSLL